MPEYHHTFTEYKDAETWLSRALDEIPPNFEIYNAGINFIAGRWRAGLSAGPSSTMNINLDQQDLFVRDDLYKIRLMNQGKRGH